MNGNVDRLLEAIRQRALVKSGALVGQVACDDRWHGTAVSLAVHCGTCGAIV